MESEFVAVYGRRRIGKTYLVREFFKGKFLRVTETIPLAPFTLSGNQSMTRDELLGKLGSKEGGRWARRLEELEQCGFIRRYNGWGKKEREELLGDGT